MKRQQPSAKPLMWFSALLMTALMAGFGGGSAIAAAGTAGRSTAPTVTGTDPSDREINVALNKTVNASFSEAMDASKITTATFTLKQGANPVSGTVSYLGTTATFVPAANLNAGAVYTATISKHVTDLAGNKL